MSTKFRSYFRGISLGVFQNSITHNISMLRGALRQDHPVFTILSAKTR